MTHTKEPRQSAGARWAEEETPAHAMSTPHHNTIGTSIIRTPPFSIDPSACRQERQQTEGRGPDGQRQHRRPGEGHGNTAEESPIS